MGEELAVGAVEPLGGARRRYAHKPVRAVYFRNGERESVRGRSRHGWTRRREEQPMVSAVWPGDARRRRAEALSRSA